MSLGEKQIECLMNVRDGYNTAYKASSIQGVDYRNTHKRFQTLEKWGFLKRKNSINDRGAIEFEIDRKVLKEYIKKQTKLLKTLNQL